MNGDLSQVLTLLHTSRRRWRTLLVLLASAVPFGGFWAGSHLREEPVSA